MIHLEGFCPSGEQTDRLLACPKTGGFCNCAYVFVKQPYDPLADRVADWAAQTGQVSELTQDRTWYDDVPRT